MSGSQPLPASLPAHPTRIILTGFMGAGKTTVGALLAARLGWTFHDSDILIETRAAMTVADIFARRGETVFRDLEAEVIREALDADPNALHEHLVLALGGGALERAATREFLASLSNTLIVFLDAPLDTMLARCAGHEGGPVRPVLTDRRRITERWNQRLPWYRQSHLIIDTATLSPDQVTRNILQFLDPALPRTCADNLPVPSGISGKTGVRA